MSLKQLKFGTSGLRGPVTAFAPQDCFDYGVSFACLLKEKFPECKRVDLAGDLRPSTPRISQYFKAALESQGIKTEYLGSIPTPAMALWASEKGNAAIMVTGSHIPADQNGVKFYTPIGEITKEDETQIQKKYLQRQTAQAKPEEDFLRDFSKTNSLEGEANQFFLERYLNFFGPTCLHGVKIIFYQHSTVGRKILPEVFRSLGAEVVNFGHSQEFIPVDTENVKNVSALQSTLIEMGGDLLLSADGDADRPLVIDANKGFIRGDVLGIVTSQLLGIRRIVTPINSTGLIDQVEYFDQVERTKIGSPYVIAGLQKLMSDSTQPSAGFEANGGFLLAREVFNSNGRGLKPLLTRDCVLPMVAYAVSKAQSKLDSLFESQGEKTNLSGLVPDFPRQISTMLMDTLSCDLNLILAEDEVLRKKFGKPRSMNTLDGVQILSEEKEVLHFRPSGNAPEFRVYVEANTDQRARDYLSRALLLCLNFLSSNIRKESQKP